MRDLSTWLRTPIVGYLAAFLLVGALLMIEKIDQAIPQVPLFIGTPFTILSIFIALVWGTGPALVALGLGLLIVTDFIAPSLLTANILRDVIIVGPFILLQCIAILTVIHLERSYRKLRQVHQQLERVSSLKDTVLTQAAHELKTPLTTILGRTQLLLSRVDKYGETPENWATLQRYLQVVEARALHLSALIDSLIDLSRAHTEAMPSQFGLCDLENLCRDAIENQQILVDRPIEVSLPTHPLLLLVDEKRFSQVLANVLNNAVKYSPKDTPITVRVYVDGKYMILEAHNECPTLTPEELEHLFDPFYRTSDAQRSSIAGWGLGLTISKEIVEQHGGQIWASSKENGITFSIKLPLPPKQM